MTSIELCSDQLHVNMFDLWNNNENNLITQQKSEGATITKAWQTCECNLLDRTSSVPVHSAVGALLPFSFKTKKFWLLSDQMRYFLFDLFDPSPILLAAVELICQWNKKKINAVVFDSSVQCKYRLTAV